MPISINEALPFNDQLDLLQAAVVDGNTDPTLYWVPGQGLAEVRKAQKASTSSEDVPWVVHPVGTDLLGARLRRWATPEKTQVSRGVQTVNPLPKLDKDLVKAYQGLGYWDGVPQLDRIAEAPVVRPDLTIRWDAGYDEPSRTYVPATVAHEGIYSTAESAAHAAQYLLSWFDPFALQFGSSRADCLALAMTPMLMSYTRELGEANIPGGIMTADEKGSGKTELARLIAVMGTGLRVKPTAWTNAQEVGKHVQTALKGSKPVVVFDNVRTSLESDTIESLLTSRSVSARKFGTQDELELVNDTLWLFTSNAPEVSPDMLRRLVVVPLSKRGFEGTWDPRVVAKAFRDRRAIVSALATMIAWWARGGALPGSRSMSGYEVWSETVSGILEAAGVEGFDAARKEASAVVVSTEEEDMGHMVGRIAKVMGMTRTVSERWTTRQLLDRVLIGDQIGDLADPDFVTVRGWLEKGTSNKQSPVMAMGHKVSSISRRDFPGVPFRIEKHSSPANSYSIVYTGQQETVAAAEAATTVGQLWVSTAAPGDS